MAASRGGIVERVKLSNERLRETSNSVPRPPSSRDWVILRVSACTSAFLRATASWFLSPRNYLELRGLQNQLAVARKNADVQAETLKITQSRLEGGRGTEFDVSTARSLLN